MFDTHKLKELRLAAGESQATVAAMLNVTQQAYANYESGRRKPDIMVISKLAKHFDIMIHDFFTDEEIKKPASVSADGSDSERLMFIASQLSGENLAKVLSFAEFLRESEHK